jgi:hypothetical protein
VAMHQLDLGCHWVSNSCHLWAKKFNCLNMANFCAIFHPKKTCVQVVAPAFWLPSGEISPPKKIIKKLKKSKKSFIAMQEKGYFIFVFN